MTKGIYNSQKAIEYIAWFFLLFPLVKIRSLAYISPGLDELLSWWSIFSLFIILVLSVPNFLKNGISKIYVVFLLFLFSGAFSTFIAHGNLINYLISSIPLFAMITAAELLHKSNLDLLIKVLLVILSVLVVLNFCSIILFSDGMYMTETGTWQSSNSWFLGYDNNHFFLIFPCVVMALLVGPAIKSQISLACLSLVIAVALLTFFLTGTLAPIVAMIVLFFVYGILKISTNSTRKLLVVVFAFLPLVLSYLIVFGFTDFLSDFVAYTGRDLTFTGRVDIWEKALIQIQTHLVFGVGYEDTQTLFLTIGQVNTHNQFLWYLYQGGVVRLSLFLMIYFYAFWKLLQSREYRYSCLLAAALFALGVYWQVEVCSENVVFLLLYIACVCNEADFFKREDINNLKISGNKTNYSN